MLKLRIFHYRQTEVIACRGNAAKVKTITEALVDQIESRTTTPSIPDASFDVPNLLINDLAQLHGDKWVENIALHSGLYSNAVHRPPLSAPAYIYHDDSIQKIKSFSGDVSGVIGETLLTVVLRRCYKLDDTCIAHFRAHKTIGIYPDFGIFFGSDEFQDQLTSVGVSSPPVGFLNPPIPCEVKTITTFDVGEGRERVTKAIGQIQNYWFREKRTEGIGVICVAVRNPSEQSYDINLIWCV